MDENIYHDQIIEWSKKADHIAKLENAHCRATASNPLCGDKVSVELELNGDVIKLMACQVRGCLLCKASSSILVERIRDLTVEELKIMWSDLDGSLKSSTDGPESFPEGYGMFFPVRSHKSRHSCVLLPFEAALKAVAEYQTRMSVHHSEGV